MYLISPFSDTGLYINLATYEAIGFDYLHSDAIRTNSRVYLRCKYDQVPKEKASSGEEEEKKPTKLAIGVDGGFDLSPKYSVSKTFQLFVFTDHPTPDNSASCGGEYIPLPFVNQQMARDKPACINSLEGDAMAEHVGRHVPEFVLNVCLEILNHDGMSSRMKVSLNSLALT